jgi:hypothetical protein
MASSGVAFRQASEEGRDLGHPRQRGVLASSLAQRSQVHIHNGGEDRSADCTVWCREPRTGCGRETMDSPEPGVGEAHPAKQARKRKVFSHPGLFHSFLVPTAQ